MTLSILNSNDLNPLPTLGDDAWQSTGDDPFFDVRFRSLRKPVIVAFLSSDTEKLDPKVYLDRGHGYREKDAVDLSPGNRFVIIADVGRSGLMRSLRIDPASQPVTFRISFHAFDDRQAAEQVIAERLASDMAGAVSHDLGRLPRFRLRLPSWPFRRSKNDIARFIAAHYDLAKEIPDLPASSTGAIWLSTVVPVYNAPKRYLDDLVRSFEQQNVSGTELVLSDDASTDAETLQWYKNFRNRKNIKIVRNTVNGGIASATNAGLQETSGIWVTLLDHDDVIAPFAFKVIGKALEENPQAAFLYTDELVVDDWLKPKGLMLKPAYDPVLLSGVNYINHFSVYRRDRLEAKGFLRTGFDGSQDYDLLLRYLDGLSDNQILHLPYPAYWWRRNGQTYSRRFIEKSTLAARAALTDRLARPQRPVSVLPAITETLHRVDFTAHSATRWPKVSVIIPSRDSLNLITRVLGDLFERTDYPDFEVIIVDNGSKDEAVLALYREYQQQKPNFSVLIREEAFNFARAINRGIDQATGEHFLILNNDVEVIEGDWLKEMVSCLQYEATGIVGAKLLYPSGKLQHAGVIAGFGGLAGHWFLNKPANYGGPMNRLHVRNSMTCVTGAVMLISGPCAEKVGLWDEENFAVAYNDVDYCLRAYKAGFRVVWTPFASLYHHESVSRGSDMVGERKRRFEGEKDRLRMLHGTQMFEDPAINPGYEKQHSTPGLAMPLRHPDARRWWI